MRSPSGWSDSLRLESQHTWLVSVVPLAVGLVLLALGGVTATLSCRRGASNEVECTVVRSLAGVRLARAELSGLTGATLRRSAGRTALHRVELDARSGAQSLTAPYSPGVPSNERVVQAVNAFVRDERATSFTATEERPLALIVVGLVFLGVGVLASPVGNPVVTWTFDGASGSLRVNRRRLFGGTTATYRLDEIASASIWSGLVALVLTSGRRLVLTTGRAHAYQSAERIRGFLGIPSEGEPAVVAVPVAQPAFRDAFAAPWRGGARAAAERPPPLPAAAVDSTATYRSFRDRLAGVVLFRAAAYRAVAEDAAASRSAATIVMSVAALVGFATGMTSPSMVVNGRSLAAGPLHALATTVVELGAGLVGWITAAAVATFVARTLFRGRTDTAEMLRVLGYASAFRVLSVVPYGSTPSWLLCALGTTIAVREAAEFTTGKAAVTAVAAWIVALAVSGVAWLLSSLAAVGVVAPLG